ncbi:hypothetical protein TVNIR_1708 [Thioalkalivibrio nitratireducens DSM 14787]|uniref:Uncharacterized protein n=1 Tax=Thioalkalivibrio nitratireducens (strain DSM 14787 / UNIQEM 213 / ALEN2) TaxID=1255043 RepID=L0DWP7_THIND|nr:hypothetical protein [Thioalkalivibrio nitratireducens]AGA33370.1 hypothetical protein TVNIR_1708 [Thioalkalivibrio nitratireducens DSM 14787]
MRAQPAAVAAIGLALAASGALAWDDDPWGDETVSPWEVHGFVEAAGGLRTRDQPLISGDASLGELRLQLEALYHGDTATWRFKADAIADAVEERLDGDLREASVSLPLGTRADLRLGRQVLTWGTGDLLFLNDLFPKDWPSFLIGRDDEYLKAPSDALRLNWFGDRANLDAVWAPVFTSDRFVDGKRVTFFDPARGERVAAPPRLRADAPPRTFENGEIALRLHGLIGPTEWALYGYRGFFGQPTAFDPETGRPTFARLDAYGASLRGPLAGGLYNLELAWYDSVDDRSGDNPNLPNSELRLLAGYERELVTHLTLGGQYYLEWLQNHDRLRAVWPFDADLAPDEYRHLFTLRLTYRMLQDNLVLSLMNFYSPSDEDYFLRPTIEYRYSDRLRLSGGANLFGGSEPQSFYGQFRDDSSLFVRARYSF